MQTPEARGKAEAGVTNTCGLCYPVHVASSQPWDHPTDNLWVGKEFLKGFYSLLTFKDNTHYQVIFKEMKTLLFIHYAKKSESPFVKMA